MPNLRLSSLISFYDYPDRKSQGHATAINSVIGEEFASALFLHHERSRGHSANRLSGGCNQGTQRGKRLDCWIRVNNGDAEVFYQTEIKNWSAHAIGGKSPPENMADGLAMASYRINRWNNQFTPSKRFKQESAEKVMIPMRRPPEAKEVRPLIIFWDAMHPDGKAEPLFEVSLRDYPFDRLLVFSMSAYARQLVSQGIEQIFVEMPLAERRMEWLGELTPI